MNPRKSKPARAKSGGTQDPATAPSPARDVVPLGRAVPEPAGNLKAREASFQSRRRQTRSR